MAGSNADSHTTTDATTTTATKVDAGWKRTLCEAIDITSPFIKFVTLGLIGVTAFLIRLFSVVRYESVIHEFDPWFNFRATEYLVQNGWRAFLNWFDEKAWYPLGRAVGVTVYPGMMLTAALADLILNKALAMDIELKNICVFMAPAFSALTALMAYKLGAMVKDDLAGLLAAGFIALVPGYISRSVAGSYDYEAIAITIMLGCYYYWLKAVRLGTVKNALITAALYYYMAASWGGYVFPANLIPLHAFCLILVGRFDHKLYTAYSVFYVVGTMASLTIPFIAYQPVSTSEHMAAMMTFCMIQIMAIMDTVRGLVDSQNYQRFCRIITFAVTALLFSAFFMLSAMGKIAPFAGRFYSLWDTSYARKHIPIIASVSEHQPTTWGSFFFDLHSLLLLAPVGIAYCAMRGEAAHLFILLYCVTASYFAGVMVRLILTLAPVMCVATGVGLSWVIDVHSASRDNVVRLSIIIPILFVLVQFVWHCTWVTSNAYSSPSIILTTMDQSGKARVIDDFREAFSWLRFNTPQDAKILSWWDYGYQIAGMADRTTIVDNNTWNNTHIATVGRILASSEEDAYPLLRELDVDYVLVLFGGVSGFAGDDLNKFLWMIRIAQGVFPEQVRETDFYNSQGEYRVDSRGSPAMLNSVMHKTSFHRYPDLMGPRAVDRARQYSVQGVNPKLSTLVGVYDSENLIVRIFKVKPLDVLGRPLILATKN